MHTRAHTNTESWHLGTVLIYKMTFQGKGGSLSLRWNREVVRGPENDLEKHGWTLCGPPGKIINCISSKTNNFFFFFFWLHTFKILQSHTVKEGTFFVHSDFSRGRPGISCFTK